MKLNCVIKIDKVLHVSLLWKRRPILSRQASELLAILKIDINYVSEENLLKEFEGIFVGVGISETFRPNFMLINQSSPLPKS